MRSRSGWLFWVLALTGASSACAAVFGFDELTDVHDAGTPPGEELPDSPQPDAGAPDAAPSPGECFARLPERPAKAPSLDTAYRFAIGSLGIRLGGTDAGVTGFDLDCADTVVASENSCRSLGGPPGTLYDELVLDRPNGVDNASLTLFAALDLQLGIDLSTLLPQLSRAGVLGGEIALASSTPLGGDLSQLYDDKLTMLFQPARGLVTPDGGCDYYRAPITPDAGDAAPPLRRLLSSDRWCVDSVYGAGNVASSAAWMVGGTVVARFPRIVVPLTFDHDIGGVSYAVIDSAYVTAKVVRRDDDSLGLMGTIAGRWKLSDLAKQFAANVGHDAGDPGCNLGPAVEGFLETQLCPGRDIATTFDVSDTAACDAISFGMDFEAYQIDQHGQETTFPSRVDECLHGGAAPDSSFYFDCP